MIGRKSLFLALALCATLGSFSACYGAWHRSVVQQPRQQAALALAISERDSATVAKLLHAGANANAPVEPPTKDLGHLGYTPLSIAVLRKDAVIVRILLENGANPNKRLAQLTPLMLAVGKKDLASVRSLLEAGANPNTEACFGHTALADARAHGEPSMTRLLLSYGATH
jgi:ankyrin repeat protein